MVKWSRRRWSDGQMVTWLNGWMAAALLLIVSSIALSAEKLPSDPRLSEKATIDCVNARLYSALDRISAKTDVKISAGRNEKEWMVRDVPALVCSRDLPLGVLLQSIADANHLLLSARKSDGVWTYRIWRDPKREAEMRAAEEARKAAAIAAASWDWDTVCRVKDLPEDALSDKQRQSNRYLVTRAMSNILSQLGTDARDNVLGGETIVLGLANSSEALKPHLMEAFKGLQAMVEASPDNANETVPSLDEQLRFAHITLRFGQPLDYPDRLDAHVSLHGVSTPIYPSEFERYWRDKQGSEYVNRPKVPQPQSESDALDPCYEKLVLRKGDQSPAFLDAKVKIPKNEAAGSLATADMQSSEGLDMLIRGKPPSYAGLLSEVSRATGYSIIAEGQAARYVGTNLSINKDLAAMYNKEITVREALQFGMELNNMEWYLDKEHKLLLGRDTEWMERLKTLVPESMLIGLRDKLKGPGIELDDVEPLVSLTNGQSRYWIYFCPEFPEINALRDIEYQAVGNPFWKLYFALTAEDKGRLKSGESVSLSGYDRGWVAGLVNEWIQREVRERVANGIPLSEPWMTGGDMFANPNAKADLSVQLKKKDVPNQSTHVYFVHLNAQVQGEPEGEWQDAIGPLPVRSKAAKPQ